MSVLVEIFLLYLCKYLKNCHAWFVDAENKLRDTFDDKQKELYHEFDILTLEYQGLQDIELIKFILEFFHTVNNPMDKNKL